MAVRKKPVMVTRSMKGDRVLVTVRPMTNPLDAIIAEFSNSDTYVRLDIGGVSRWENVIEVNIVDTLQPLK